MPILPSTGAGLRVRWSMLVIAVVITAALAGLGIWQLERAHEKESRAERMRERARASPRTVAQLAGLEDPAHYPVADSGRLDHDRAILLDNRIRDGRAGYHLLVPFHSNSGAWVLVNQGWLPRGRSRDLLPEIPRVNGEVLIRGRAHVRAGEPLVLQQDALAEQDWPLRIQRVDREALARRLGVELAPFIVRLAPEPGFTTGTRPVQASTEQLMGPERHYAYALQWFALALLTPVLFLLAGRRRSQRE